MTVAGFSFAAPAQAQDAVTTWNQTLLSLIQQTSGLRADGPPEVAREMAIMGSALYNAAQQATASGQDVDAAINAAGYAAAMAMFSAAGSNAGNPNTGNTTVVANIWSNTQPGGSATASPDASIGSGSNLTTQQLTNMQTQINKAYKSVAGSSAPLPTTALLSAASNASAVVTGYQAAADVIAARYGSLTTNATGDGAYTSIIASMNPANYAPSSYGTSQLAPGATPGTPTVADPNAGVGVYVPLPNISASGHIAITPTWGTVNNATLTNINDTTFNVNPALGGIPNVTGSEYANRLMLTYCTGGYGAQGAAAGSQASVCAAAGQSQDLNATIAGTTITSGANSLTASGIGSNTLITNALFWNDPGTTEQPPGHWLDITTNTILTAQATNALTELQEAELTALVGDAELNAGIAAWNAKYADNLWRPTTAITGRAGSGSCQYTSGGNVWNTTLASYGFSCDANWSSYIGTPPHPDYVAGHPAFSGAAAQVLTAFFNTTDPSILAMGFDSTSNSYCNGGGSTAVYGVDSLGNPITSPWVPTVNTPSGATANAPLTTIVGCKVGNVIYGLNTSINYNSTYTYTPTATDGSATGITAATPGGIYIPQITEHFTDFLAASNAATDSRVNGGIHTIFSVDDALIIGNAVGIAVAQDAGFTVAEPTSILVFASGLSGIGWFRRRRRVR